jgi:hypothetical protein
VTAMRSWASRSSRTVKMSESGVQVKKSLRPLELAEPKLLWLLTSCRTMGLLNKIVTAGRRDHFLMVNMFERWKLTNRCFITRQFIGAYRVRDVIFSQ